MSDKPGDKIEVRNLSVSYGSRRILGGITMGLADRKATALIGPSGCGKSTFLRAINRLHETVPDARAEGEVRLDGVDVLGSAVDVVTLRPRVGMVFQKPNPFELSIFDNVAFGPRLHGRPDAAALQRVVEESLKRAALWDEVRDRLHDPATGLSSGQQQRLCIARALAVKPEVILLDEPTSALDPAATAHIEELMVDLKRDHAVVLVTHSMRQAAKVADVTAFFYAGDLAEFGPTAGMFAAPRHPELKKYLAVMGGH
jgi:phosphate transport system ATP-binding protein